LRRPIGQAPIRFWAAKYKTKFNEDPTVFSVYGYMIMDEFIQAAQKAGPNLTTDTFVKAMDNISFPAGAASIRPAPCPAGRS
jgi:ABC-type branched-subunit amino acid transport system substrate-binding protein